MKGDPKKMKRSLFALITSIACLLYAGEPAEHDKRITESANVLSEILNAKDQSIPSDLLQKAYCVGVIPNLKRVGFIVGGKYGKGVLTCRINGGNSWSGPVTMRIEGGNIGLQIGAGETDVVLVVMNQRGADALLKDKFTIGADVSAMAGPVGRSAEAKTDAKMHAEILSYSRSRGLFAGVTLDGATLRPDNDDNTKIYGANVTRSQILHGEVPAPESAKALIATLNAYPASGTN
jgi:lipid-binding SYLF domain-containing protein